MASLPSDVQREILLRLPVESLLRFRATSKFYRDTIDSPNFQKSHLVQNTDKDDTILLQFNSVRGEVSLLLPYSKEFITCGEFCYDSDFGPESYDLRVVGPVDGLICIHDRWCGEEIGMCNPGLGQIKMLPLSSPTLPFCNCPYTTDRGVGFGIGFDQDYKVVQLLSCYEHRRLHASVYSKRTNSWREVVDNNIRRLYAIEPIKSSCKRGSFVHWRAIWSRWRRQGTGIFVKNYILSFDMKNEVFRTLYMPQYESLSKRGDVKIFAKGEDSFVLFVSQEKVLKIYESMIQGNRVFWDLSARVKSPCGVTIPTPKAMWGNNLVGFTNRELVVYDYHAREFVKRLHLPAANTNSSIIEYKGSFVSP